MADLEENFKLNIHKFRCRDKKLRFHFCFSTRQKKSNRSPSDRANLRIIKHKMKNRNDGRQPGVALEYPLRLVPDTCAGKGRHRTHFERNISFDCFLTLDEVAKGQFGPLMSLPRRRAHAVKR